MSDPSSKSFHDTTPLVQDNKNQENASAQEPPPPYNPPLAYTETKGAPPPNMTPPPEYKKTSSSRRQPLLSNLSTSIGTLSSSMLYKDRDVHCSHLWLYKIQSVSRRLSNWGKVMSDNPSKSSHETLAQDHENQENASAQEPPPPYNPPPAYAETKGAPPPNMTPPPEYNETPSSIPHASTTPTVFVVPMEFHSKPAEVTCPYCNVPITTRVEHEDVNHFCPICQRLLGRYHRPCSSRIVAFVIIIVGISIFLSILRAEYLVA
uniref:LITAF domain-containing protein n=1 Tax=Acrobeloides nanus TaxID=290746 RepID=A0A914BWU1_9BILA